MAQRNADLDRRALAMLDELLETPPVKQEARLLALAGADAELQQRLRALLAADSAAQVETFLSAGAAADVGAPRSPGTPDPELVGRRFGPWRVTAPLGAGGMGQVWLAERSDAMYRGQAAIKLLGRGAFATYARARFVREGELLGRLSHPNIARLLDAGVADGGERYLVLEYVDGQRIDRYCDQQRLTLPKRIELFRAVCTAVAHAHRNLIVHRDLKPSNVLVTGAGEVKLLDFGIAKLLEPDSDEPPAAADARTMAAPELTEMAGAALTPEYAAPEQVLGTPITTRTDVYSLGVMLYLMLTGEHPYISSETTPALRYKAVIENEPRRGSETVTRPGEQTQAIASNRGLSPAKLRDDLRGDLDNIMARALKKSPDERYASVEDLSRDLEHYLNHEPIEARADSFGYRARKFLRRNRLAVAAAVLVTLSMLGGLAAAIWQAGIARDQARVARVESAKATAVKEFILDLFKANDVNSAGGATRGETTVSQMLDRGVQKISAGGLEEQPEVQAELLDAIAILHLQTEEPEKGEKLYRMMHEVRRKLYGESDPRTVDALVSVGTGLRNQNKYDEALVVYQSAIAQLDAAGQQAPLVRGRALLEMAYAMFRVKPYDRRGIEYAEQSLKLLLPTQNAEQLYNAYYAVARAYEGGGRYREAIRNYSEGMVYAAKALGPRTTAVAGGTQMRAGALSDSGQFTRAEREFASAVNLFRALVGEKHRYYLSANREYGDVRERLGGWRVAEPALRADLENEERNRGSDHPLTVGSRSSLARLLLRSGDLRGAQAEYLKVIELPGLASKRPSSVFFSLLGLATVEVAQGNVARANSWLRRAEALLPQVQETMRDSAQDRFLMQTRLALLQADIATRSGNGAARSEALGRAADNYARLSADSQGDREIFWRLRLLQAESPSQLESLLTEIRAHVERKAYGHIEAEVAFALGQMYRKTGDEKAACGPLQAAAELRRQLTRDNSMPRREAEQAAARCP